jgi:hypothetical protein
MEFSTEMAILIIAVLIVASVGYLQVRYMRSRKQGDIERAIERDDAYNAVATTNAVAASLRQAGRDTSEADVLLYKAEGALERREFMESIDLAKRAKTILLTCKPRDPLLTPVEVTGPHEPREVPANEVRKMPPNLLESKFIIESVRDLLPRGGPEVKEEASHALALAEACFERGDYTTSLKEGMRAKRLLAPPPSANKPITGEVIRIPPPNKPAAPPAARSCPRCSVDALPDDAFCRKCGTRIEA